MPPRSTKGKPPTRYEGMPPPPPPKPAPKPSAATTRPEDVSLPVPHPKQVRKRRSNTNVSELERRTHKEAEEAEDPLQAIATRVLKLNPPTPKKLFLSAPAIPATPGHQTPSRVHLRPPIPPPRRDAVTPSPREPPNTHQEPQRQDQLPNPTDPAKRPTIDTQDSTKDAHMIPDSFRQDPWWSDGTQTTTEAVDKFRKALRRTSTTRETIQIDDDDKSNDGLQYLPSQLNYNDEKLFPSSQRSQPTPAEDTAEKNKKAATLQPKATKTTYQQPESQQHQQPELHVPSSQPPPSQEPPPSQQPPKASLPPSSGGTSKKGQKAAAPQPKHTKKKPEKSESEQEEEEIKFVSRVWWGGNEKTPIYENTQTRLMEDFDIRTRFKEMDRWVKHHHAGPKGLNAFLTSATATPANQKLPKAQQHPVILEKDGLERTWRTEVVKTIDKFKNRTIWVNLDFKYSPNTTGVNPAPSSSSKEKSKKKSLGTPTEQLGEKEKAFSQAQGRVKQQADEFARILHCEDAVCPHKNMPCWNDNGTHVRLTGRDLLVWANHYVHCDGVFDHRNPPPGLASKLRENAHKSSKQLKKELAASASLQPWQPVQPYPGQQQAFQGAPYQTPNAYPLTGPPSYPPQNPSSIVPSFGAHTEPSLPRQEHGYNHQGYGQQGPTRPANEGRSSPVTSGDWDGYLAYLKEKYNDDTLQQLYQEAVDKLKKEGFDPETIQDMKYNPDGLKELQDMGIRRGVVTGITREVSRWDAHRKSVEARKMSEALIAQRPPLRLDLSQDVDVDLTQDNVDEDDRSTTPEDEDELEDGPPDERRRSQVTTTDESDSG